MDEYLTPIVDWVETVEVEPVSEKLVPGTTATERRSLAALGALVAAVADEAIESESWPELIRGWMTIDVTVPATVRAAFTDGVTGAGASQFLASVYERCVANVSRRHLGTFFTPPRFVADMLSDWDTLAGAPASVVDIGAGVGAFAVAACQRWPRSSVYGVDVNPVTLGLMGLLSHAQGIPLVPPSATGAGLRLIADDFVAWSRDFEALPGPRLILGNPPFTRMQLLSREDRQRLAAALPGKVGSRASLATWMLAQSLELLGPGDGLALLLPAHWLEADYAAGIREQLWGMTRREVKLELLGADVFPDARVDAVSLLVSVVRRSKQRLTVSERGQARELDRAGKSPPSLRLPSTAAVRVIGGRPLASLAMTRRGTATGANSFFLLSEEQRQDLGLPEDVVVPLLRRLHGHGERVTARTLAQLGDQIPRWMLIADRADRMRTAGLRAYVREAELNGVQRGFLCSQREDWFDLRHDLVVPHVVIGPTTRSHFTVVVTDGAVAITNNLHGLTWRPGVKKPTQAAVVEWLRADEGQRALRALARHQAHDLWKLEPGALKKLAVPESVL